MPFLLTAANNFDQYGNSISALDVFEERCRLNRWYIYEGTRNRKLLRVDDEVLFYVSGRALVPQIIARAKIAVVRKPKPREYDQFAHSIVYAVLEFRSVKRLEKPIDFKQVLPTLSFAPENMQKWGVVVLGGCRKLSQDDFDKILVSEHKIEPRS